MIIFVTMYEKYLKKDLLNHEIKILNILKLCINVVEKVAIN